MWPARPPQGPGWTPTLPPAPRPCPPPSAGLPRGPPGRRPARASGAGGVQSINAPLLLCALLCRYTTAASLAADLRELLGQASSGRAPAGTCAWGRCGSRARASCCGPLDAPRPLALPPHHSCGPLRWTGGSSRRLLLPPAFPSHLAAGPGRGDGCGPLHGRPPMLPPSLPRPSSSQPPQLDLGEVTVVGCSMGCAVIWSYIELFGQARLKQARLTSCCGAAAAGQLQWRRCCGAAAAGPLLRGSCSGAAAAGQLQRGRCACRPSPPWQRTPCSCPQAVLAGQSPRLTPTHAHAARSPPQAVFVDQAPLQNLAQDWCGEFELSVIFALDNLTKFSFRLFFLKCALI